jgi:hypothetical protein
MQLEFKTRDEIRHQVGALGLVFEAAWLGSSDLVCGSGVVKPGVEELCGLGFVAGEEVAVAVEGDCD